MTRVSSRACPLSNKKPNGQFCVSFLQSVTEKENPLAICSRVCCFLDSTNSSTNNHHNHQGTEQNKMEIMEASIEAINIGLDDDKLDDEEIEREVQVRWNIIVA